MKATTIRLPSNLKTWVEDQAVLSQRTVFGQVRYVLTLVLEDWEWMRERDLERVREAWSTAAGTTPDKEIKIDTNDEIMSVRIPPTMFDSIAKIADSLERSTNEQISYLLNLANGNWTTLQERHLQRFVEKKTKETILPELPMLIPA